MANIKKTCYYNFVPTKEEESAVRRGIVHPTVLEIRDNDHSSPGILRHLFPTKVEEEVRAKIKMDGRGIVLTNDRDYPWTIKKMITDKEAKYGILALSQCDTNEHILKYWKNDIGAKRLFDLGLMTNVLIWDLTDKKHPAKYGIETGDIDLTFFKDRIAGEGYCLGLGTTLARARKLKAGHTIGNFADENVPGHFYFKLFG